MVPKTHIILGFIFSLLLYLLFKDIGIIGAGIIFISSFMIDIDHYIYFIFKKKSLSPNKSVKWFFGKRGKSKHIKKEKLAKYYSGFYFLHGFESLIILIILGIFVSKIFLMIFIGFAFHLFLDLIIEVKYKERIDKISIIYDFIKFKKLKEIE